MIMNYRLKIVEYKSGRKLHFAQVKTIWGWRWLNSLAVTSLLYKHKFSNRDTALKAIDFYYKCKEKW